MSEQVRPVQLVLMAMGFLGPEQPLLEALSVERDARTNIKADFEKYPRDEGADLRLAGAAGATLVWIPAGLYLIFAQGETAWGIFLLAWGALVVSSVDNVLKPMIISRGSDLPFILVMLGVFGGVVAFGFIGVFLGPVLLALGFVLVKEWAAPTHNNPGDALP